MVTTDLSDSERLLLARETMADRYGQRLTSFVYNPPQVRDAFLTGWDAAMEWIGRLIQTPGGDGCYCAHHPDDPAHTKDCYDLVKALTGG